MPAGFILRHAEPKGLNTLYFDVLRDPKAVTTEQWLEQFDLKGRQSIVVQDLYLSAAPEIVQLRAMDILEQFPTLRNSWSEETLTIQGTVSIPDYNKLTQQLSAVLGFSDTFSIDTQKLAINQGQDDENPDGPQSLFYKIRGKIQQTQFDFPISSATLASEELSKVVQLIEDYHDLKLLADNRAHHVGIVLIGTADSSGGSTTNQELSQARASAVRTLLIERGVNADDVMAVGIGKIDLPQMATTGRKVLVNVVYHPNTMVHTQEVGNKNLQ